MRAPAPLPLGCISLVLCLLQLQLPAGRATQRSTRSLPPGTDPSAVPPLAPRHAVLRHEPRHERGRRHAAGRLQPAQLLRVGCVLGTCQVQNLSHRLWQLMGRSGRQDSSPMNPNSPHSYG
ncbi:protein ADM2 [Pelecanus crispus]|uniref:protein ADM2 n=1 Tax=Pelecanus crispus TaxID=36300 RepID=UPI003F5CFEA5